MSNCLFLSKSPCNKKDNVQRAGSHPLHIWVLHQGFFTIMMSRCTWSLTQSPHCPREQHASHACPAAHQEFQGLTYLYLRCARTSRHKQTWKRSVDIHIDIIQVFHCSFSVCIGRICLTWKKSSLVCFHFLSLSLSPSEVKENHAIIIIDLY